MGKGHWRKGNKKDEDAAGENTDTRGVMKFGPRNPKVRYATYVALQAQIISDMKREKYAYWEDIVTSIETGVLLDIESQRPVIQRSTLEEGPARTYEEEAFKAEHTLFMQEFIARRKAFNCNEGSVYELILHDYCTEGMRTKVEVLTQTNSEIKDNPVELLKVLKRLSTETTGLHSVM